MPSRPKRRCEHCGEDLFNAHRTKRFCSDWCQRQARPQWHVPTTIAGRFRERYGDEAQTRIAMALEGYLDRFLEGKE